MSCIDPELGLEGSWEKDEITISLITTELFLSFLWFSV